jgi:hypothetical protein
MPNPFEIELTEEDEREYQEYLDSYNEDYYQRLDKEHQYQRFFED